MGQKHKNRQNHFSWILKVDKTTERDNIFANVNAGNSKKLSKATIAIKLLVRLN